MKARKYTETVATFSSLKPFGILDSQTINRYILFLVDRIKMLNGRGNVDEATLDKLDDILRYAIEHQEIASARFWRIMLQSYIDLNLFDKASLIADMSLSHMEFLPKDERVLGNLYISALQAKILGGASFEQCGKIGSAIHEQLEGKEVVNELVAVYLIYTVFKDQGISSKAHKALVQFNGLTSFHSDVIISVFVNKGLVDQAAAYLKNSNLNERNLPTIYTTVWLLQRLFEAHHSLDPLLTIFDYYLSVSPKDITRLTNAILSLSMKQFERDRDIKKATDFITTFINKMSDVKEFKPSISTANTLFSIASRLKDVKWLSAGFDMIDKYGLKPTHVTYRSLLKAYCLLPSTCEQISQAWVNLEYRLEAISISVADKEINLLKDCILSQPDRDDQQSCLQFLNMVLSKYGKHIRSP